MSQDRRRHRDGSEQERPVYNGIVREDCPCPKTNCRRRTLCDLCRQHHKKMPPYCERDAAK